MNINNLRTYTSIFILAVAILSGCNSADKKSNRQVHGTIIFIDKSLSADTLTTKQMGEVLGILQDSTINTNDFISFGALCDQTANNFLGSDEKLELGKPNGESVGDLEDFESEKVRRRANFAESVISRLHTHSLVKNKEVTARYTDILGSFASIHQKFGKVKGGKTLIYLSDMIQSSPMRDFDKQKQNSLDQVRKYGIEDAQKVKEIYKLDNNLLKGTRIAVVFPDKGLAPNRNSEMKAYWESVFSALGAEQNNISFQ